MDIPRYLYTCKRIDIGPIDYFDPENPGFQTLPTFDQIYSWYSGYVFVGPLYNGLALERLMFTSRVCSDCSMTGDLQKPYFWVDIIE